MAAFSFADYTAFLYSLPQHYPAVATSTLQIYKQSASTAFVRGSIYLHGGLELQVFEYLDTIDGQVLEYSYTMLHGGDRIRWYDPQPHPELPELASTFPHHLHEPPDIKHNRRPAPGLGFSTSNIHILIADCVELGKSRSEQ